MYPVWADIDVYRSVRIDSGTLDLTLLVNNLFLSQDKPQLVREMARLTRPGGRIVVVEWKPVKTPIGPPLDQRLEPAMAREMLSSPLIKCYDDFEAGPFHYGMVYLRTNERVG